MRAIKFRAFGSQGQGMFEVKQLDFTNMSCNGVTNCKLMQFTGLLDKNGKEIYEGDLIKVNINVCVSGHAYTGDDEWIDVDYYAVVKFMPSKGFYGKVLRATNNIDDTEPRATKMVTIASYRTETIGNIYENPELAGRTE